MEVSFLQLSPLRRPQWRADRAMQLVERCQRPRRWDDRFVRMYCRFLNESIAASGDEQRLLLAELNSPDVILAHTLHFGDDRERRHILQARLLTQESFDDIAKRFEVPVGAINCYEKIFFNVCDRLKCHDWMAKIVRGERETRGTIRQDVVTEQQRAMLYRWFGFYGGPLVLDATILALSPTGLATSTGNSVEWCDEALRQTIRCKAVTALCALEIDQNNAMPLLKRWLRQQRVSTGDRKRHQAPPVDTAKNIEVFLAQFAASSG
jgi:hypothetical protein